MKPRITDLDLDDLRRLAERSGLQPYRGNQAFEWIMAHGITEPGRMTNLPPAFRELLASDTDTAPPRIEASRDETTTTDKVLLRLTDGQAVEAVLIMEGDRTTVCLSTQVGCPVGCRFCASGLLGLKRNLSRGEILDQFIALRARGLELGRRISNVVMMGMGEPMLNLGNTLGALRVLNHPRGGGIGARHLTISTVGLRKGVDKLKTEGRQYTLAFSLHAPDDELRNRLIPFEGAMSVAELVDAARGHLAATGREVTFEYVLLGGLNDSPSHARRLGHVLEGLQCTVNVIPYNENPGLPYQRPTPEVVDRFVETLRRARVNVCVRKQKGNAILAACGQLRLRDEGLRTEC